MKDAKVKYKKSRTDNNVKWPTKFQISNVIYKNWMMSNGSSL